MAIGPFPATSALLSHVSDAIALVTEVCGKVDKALVAPGLMSLNSAVELFTSIANTGVRVGNLEVVMELRAAFITAITWQYRARLVMAGLVPTTNGYKHRKLVLYDEETGVPLRGNKAKAIEQQRERAAATRDDSDEGEDGDVDDDGFGSVKPSILMIDNVIDELKGVKIATPEVRC